MQDLHEIAETLARSYIPPANASKKSSSKDPYSRESSSGRVRVEVQDRILADFPRYIKTIFISSKHSIMDRAWAEKHHQMKKTKHDSSRSKNYYIEGETGLMAQVNKMTMTTKQWLMKENRRKQKTVFLECLKTIAYIFDPWREESLTSLCFSRAAEKVWHKIPLSEVLRPGVIRIIEEGRYQDLPRLFEALSENPNVQRTQFRNGFIMLSPWEYLCLTLGRYTSTVQTHRGFFSLQEYEEDPMEAYDDSRLALTVFVKLLHFCQTQKQEWRATSNLCRTKDFERRAQFLSYVVEDCFMAPLIEQFLGERHRLNQAGMTNWDRFGTTEKAVGGERLEVTTQSLEAVMFWINNLQSEEQLFRYSGMRGEASRQRPSLVQALLQKEVRMTSQRVIYLNEPEANLLKNHKLSLFQFFQTAFELASHKDTARNPKTNKLSDVALLWLQVLMPWKNSNAAFTHMLRVEEGAQQKHELGHHRLESDKYQTHRRVKLSFGNEKSFFRPLLLFVRYLINYVLNLIFPIQLFANFSILDPICQPNLTEAFENTLSINHLLSDTDQDELRNIYSLYISDMLPFYLELLIQFIVNMGQQTQYSLEDFEVFHRITHNFELFEVGNSQLLFQGYVDLKFFKSMMAKASTPGHRSDLRELSIDPNMDSFNLDVLEHWVMTTTQKMMNQKLIKGPGGVNQASKDTAKQIIEDCARTWKELFAALGGDHYGYGVAPTDYSGRKGFQSTLKDRECRNLKDFSDSPSPLKWSTKKYQ